MGVLRAPDGTWGAPLRLGPGRSRPSRPRRRRRGELLAVWGRIGGPSRWCVDAATLRGAAADRVEVGCRDGVGFLRPRVVRAPQGGAVVAEEVTPYPFTPTGTTVEVTARDAAGAWSPPQLAIALVGDTADPAESTGGRTAVPAVVSRGGVQFTRLSVAVVGADGSVLRRIGGPARPTPPAEHQRRRAAPRPGRAGGAAADARAHPQVLAAEHPDAGLEVPRQGTPGLPGVAAAEQDDVDQQRVELLEVDAILVARRRAGTPRRRPRRRRPGSRRTGASSPGRPRGGRRRRPGRRSRAARRRRGSRCRPRGRRAGGRAAPADRPRSGRRARRRLQAARNGRVERPGGDGLLGHGAQAALGVELAASRPATGRSRCGQGADEVVASATPNAGAPARCSPARPRPSASSCPGRRRGRSTRARGSGAVGAVARRRAPRASAARPPRRASAGRRPRRGTRRAARRGRCFTNAARPSARVSRSARLIEPPCTAWPPRPPRRARRRPRPPGRRRSRARERPRAQLREQPGAGALHHVEHVAKPSGPP